MGAFINAVGAAANKAAAEGAVAAVASLKPQRHDFHLGVLLRLLTYVLEIQCRSVHVAASATLGWFTLRAVSQLNRKAKPRCIVDCNAGCLTRWFDRHI